MLRKTGLLTIPQYVGALASMRPQRNAAENGPTAMRATPSLVGFNEAAA